MRTLSILLVAAFFAPILISADLPKKDAPEPVDEILNWWKATPQHLKIARLSPSAQMFVEQAKIEADPNQELIITSAIGEDGKPHEDWVKSRNIHIFLANPDVDDFTRQGGVYWRQGKTTGTVKFKQPGALIMIVRHPDGTVNWFTLHPDFRC